MKTMLSYKGNKQPNTSGYMTMKLYEQYGHFIGMTMVFFTVSKIREKYPGD